MVGTSFRVSPESSSMKIRAIKVNVLSVSTKGAEDTSLHEFSNNKSEGKRAQWTSKGISVPIRVPRSFFFRRARQDPFRVRCSIYLVDVVEPKTVEIVAGGSDTLRAWPPATSGYLPFATLSLAVPMVLAMMNQSRKAIPLSGIARRGGSGESDSGALLNFVR